MSVVEEAVEEGGSHGSITGKDLRPVFEGDVGGDDDGARFVAFANDSKEEFGAAFVEREIAEFVEEKQRWVLVAFHFAIELALGVNRLCAAASASPDCKSALNFLPSGCLPGVVAVSGKAFIQNSQMIFADWKFIATRASEPHRKPFQEFFLFLKREHFEGGFNFGKRAHGCER
jgi:hypothetical protein